MDDYIIDPTKPTTYIDNGITINGNGDISKWVNPTQLACKQYDLIRVIIQEYDNFLCPIQYTDYTAKNFGKVILAMPLNYNDFIQTTSKDENGEYTMMIETNGIDLLKSSNPRFVFLSNSYGAFGIKSLENSVGYNILDSLKKIAEEDTTLSEAEKTELEEYIEGGLIGFNPEFVNLEEYPDKIQVSDTSITLKIPFDNLFEYANYPNYYEDDLVNYDKEGEGTGNMILWITGD